MTPATPRAPAAAPAARAIAAQTAMELRLTARRGENLIVTIVIPSVLLVFFASVSVLPTGVDRPADFLLPGALALALVSTGLVNLGIATAYERYYGVLKRLGGSPLPRAGLVAAKILAVASVELVQLVLLVGIAAGLFGWAPGPRADLGLVAVALVLGTAAFAGMGLAMAGHLRAEATLAGANGLFLVLLLLGGVVMPVDHLPGPLEALARLLPASPLADLLRAGFDSGLDGAAVDVPGALAILGAWAIGAIVTAGRSFRWE